LTGNRFLRYFNKLLRLCLCVWLPISGFGQAPGATSPRAVIVIDAGHGGKDPGAIGRKVQEKSVTLAVALKLGELISGNMDDVKVIYTRDSDEFIELYQRAALANRNKADLFISIHCNANKNKTLRGAETYIMGLHRSTANLEVAKFENASILLESDYNKEYEGFDPNSDESYIIFSLYQNSNLDLSTRLAASIQVQMSERVGLADRGVRQAGFLVLYKTTMPSVLAEIGYLSNGEEEAFLTSPKGQDYIASALYRAVREYRKEMAEGVPAVQDSRVKPQVAVDGTSKKQAVYYSIQVKSSPTQIRTDAASFKGLEGVEMYRYAGVYKYKVGRLFDLKQATAMLEEVKKKGFTDAFVIAFKGTERITVIQAKEILGR
jgi:N-acetylmuramoyl-L-alanine amidase